MVDAVVKTQGPVLVGQSASRMQVMNWLVLLQTPKLWRFAAAEAVFAKLSE